MCVLSFINCKIRPQESSILTRLCILNFIMVNNADTNDKSQIAISRKKPRFYSQKNI